MPPSRVSVHTGTPADVTVRIWYEVATSGVIPGLLMLAAAVSSNSLVPLP
mgnify:CR=1 FL=1